MTSEIKIIAPNRLKSLGETSEPITDKNIKERSDHHRSEFVKAIAVSSQSIQRSQSRLNNSMNGNALVSAWSSRE
jgi:hypothetical protein